MPAVRIKFFMYDCCATGTDEDAVAFAMLPLPVSLHGEVSTFGWVRGKLDQPEPQFGAHSFVLSLLLTQKLRSVAVAVASFAPVVKSTIWIVGLDV
jgi:hypothetical protein